MKDRKKLFSRLWDLPYGRTTPYHLFDASKNSIDLVQKFQLQRKIPVHNGCVNSICWNETGSYLLSGSDDQHLSVINGYDYSVLAYIRTGHRANIFSAKFLPSSGDSHVISSSGDGIIIYSNLERPETSLNNKFGCHKGTAYEIVTVPNDPNTFLSCGEDRTVRWFDVRTKTSCDAEDCKDDVLIFCRSPVTSIAVNPLIPYQLAVGCADSSVQIFDRRMLSTQATAGCLSNGFRALQTYFTVPDFPQSRRITSLSYSADGREMLVSYSSDYIYLFDIKDDMGRKPKVLCTDSGPYSRTRPIMKRLRVRGDWSDTGPNSRPEAESGENRDTSSPNNLVRRMTDILTRMLFSTTRSRPSSAASSESSPLASSHSEDGDVEAGPDSNIDDGGRGAVANSEINTEANTSQASESNENTPQTVANNSTQTDDNSDLVTNNSSAFDQRKTEPQLSDESDMPSTSGLMPKCDSTLSVIKHCSISPEIFESIPTSSQPVPDEVQRNSSDSATAKRTSSTSTQQSSENQKEFNYLTSSSQDIILEDDSSASASEMNAISRKGISDNETESAVQSIQQEENMSVISEIQSPRSPSPETLLIDDVNMRKWSAGVSMERGSESDTEAAVQSIQPTESLPAISELQSPRSPSPEPVVENPDEVELMMEVDSWDSDSDDASEQPRSSHSNRSSRRRGRAHSSNDETDEHKEEVKKDKPPKNVTRPRVKKMFTGHRNARTMIKESTFWGDNFVMSGSDCGHIFVWDRHTTELVMILEADHHVVNCLQPHPFDPILASSGIDYDIKVWAPLKEESFFDIEKANEIVKRNEIMLEVTKDTITVPASFMFNMFNTLNNLRNGHRQLYRWSRLSRSINPDTSTR